MDTSKVPLVICLTVFIVVGINAALIVALRRGKEAGQIDLLRKAVGRARDPWAGENSSLKELSQRVAELQAKRPGGEEAQNDR
jgi:hypothetical protein